ncbi:hypothetical protein N825_08240 [Skermanella stibiiresistens SB22]|uniref:Uncharacterized protein n=1 Tax=Skermanella stibiiresistens SB22 TaxID=1385369 RepID=W9GYG6_9PROT|nr:hypothetical protein [Skermanella stibiiresistens]EWY38980.1 hypothetical protein N825_08240 [Skermanella stibiiresistens SB22]
MLGSMTLEIIVLAVAAAGLAAVILEIIVKDPKALFEITTDVAAMAQPVRRSAAYSPVSNTNLRKAA